MEEETGRGKERKSMERLVEVGNGKWDGWRKKLVGEEGEE